MLPAIKSIAKYLMYATDNKDSSAMGKSSLAMKMSLRKKEIEL